ncbi:OCRL_1 [Blepharisma stoltei]|uniref:Rho-GAP domain-containing protein n=1 Tax=Blepharisma stoltei TaxID=1481888 RepID=A0AAU9IMW8_9CILI|nr:unnamed protein product [Blepharisma stoltei]
MSKTIASTKIIQSKLRDSETVLHVEPISLFHKNKFRDFFLSIIGNKTSQCEYALFLFRPRNMYPLNNKLDLIQAFPLTKELKLFHTSTGYTIQWLNYLETEWKIKVISNDFINLIGNYLEEAIKYQRDPFNSNATSYKWLWFYEEMIPAQVKMINAEEEEAAAKRSSLLHPEDYGKEAMDFYINEQLRKRESEFTEKRNIRIMVGTWNTAGTQPQEELSLWYKCQSEKYDSPEESPDILLICLQEMCELTAKNLLGAEARMREWTNHLCEQVNLSFPGNDYVVAGYQSLVGLLSLIIVKSSLQEYLSNIKDSCVKLGLKGYTGNKGAICQRFSFFDSTICVINCHLAAHKHQTRLRNHHVKSILKYAKFTLDDKEIKGIYEHDYIFWTGDLNYRLNKLNTDEILSRLNSQQYDELLRYDQFDIEKKTNQILADFSEGKIDFPPSFKYYIGSNKFDTNNKRDPSWCDRVLWKGEAQLIRYGICSYVIQSDHKPVFASFLIRVKQADSELKEKVRNEIYKIIDEVQYEALPKLTLSTISMEFPGVKYKVPQSQKLSIENTGNSFAIFEIKEYAELTKNKSYLSISPTTGSLSPGESTELIITVDFGKHQSRLANKDDDYLSLIFILGVIGGSDYYIEVSIDYKGSCFGAKIQDLVKISYPVASLPNRMEWVASQLEPIVEVPKELLRMINFIKNFGSREKGLFQETGILEIKAHIRDVLDNGEPFREDVDVFSMSIVMLEFLESLDEPLLPSDLIDGCVKVFQSSSFASARANLLQNLDPVAECCFLAIIHFLRHLIDNGLHNGLTANFLAKVFTEPLTHKGEIEIKGIRRNEEDSLESERKHLISMFFYS